MQIEISKIPEEGLSFVVEAIQEPWFFDLLQEVYQGDLVTPPATLEVQLHKTGENVTLEGSVTVFLKPDCDRCLEKFSLPAKIPLYTHLSPFKEEYREQDDLSPEDSSDEHFSFYEGGRIDLPQVLRETLIMDIPFAYLCSDQCKGLCPRCGVNLNQQSCSCVVGEDQGPFSSLKEIFKRE